VRGKPLGFPFAKHPLHSPTVSGSPRISRHSPALPRVRRAIKKELPAPTIVTHTEETQEVPVHAPARTIKKIPMKEVKKPGTILSMQPVSTPIKTKGYDFSLPKALSRIEGQAVAAVAAIIAVVAIAQGTIRSETPVLTAQVTQGEKTEIGLEHSKPITLSLALTVNGRKGVADIRHDALETAHLSLPSSWVRREVKGVPLSAVTAEEPIFGFTRWALPPGALVSFDIVPPATLVLHHPTNIPAEIELTRVNLANGTVEKDIVLVQDGSVVLW